ncbi:MAG: GHKL domain-containing protein [Lachnospiraceae bacterium]|nr:GHKL domain-containing protein [Lachnospiraceae bacterium]
MDFLGIGFLYYLIYSFVIMLTIERFMGVFLEERRTSRLVTVGSYLLFYVFFCLGGLVNSLFMQLALLTYFIIAMNYKSSMIKRLVAAVCSYLCIQIVQGIFVVVAGLYPDGNDIYDVDTIMLLILISALLNYVIASFFRKFKNIKKSTMSLPVSWISLLLVPVFSVTIIIFQYIYITYLPQPVVAAICIIAFVIIAVTFYFQDTISKAYKDKLKSALHSQEKEYYFAQCQLMKESGEKVKSIHHDMKLHLTTVRDYAVNNKFDEVVDYLGSLLGEIGTVENYSDTGNIAFDSIINYKLKDAVRDGIKLDIDVSIPPVLNIEVADVVTILGNLLDNALEAVTKTEDKKIKLSIESTNGNLFIIMENTFDGEVHYEPGMSGAIEAIATRKEVGGHGHGLKNIRKSTEKYDGHMDINYDGNIFIVGILLYL